MQISTKEQFLQISREPVAVLLIDMQEAFVAKLSQKSKQTILSGQKRIISLCADLDIPLVILQLRGARGRFGPTLQTLQKATAEVPRTRTIDKWYDDGFKMPDLNKTLQEWGVASLILMGMNRSYCVWETAHSAVNLGYKVRSAENLIADTEPVDTESRSENWYHQNGILVRAISMVAN